ncbi:MAG: DEAD/DEAH box helicase family protein, partial [Candidatus Bathyarchaeia archaeon]
MLSTGSWEEYLSYLDESPYSVRAQVFNLSPRVAQPHRLSVQIEKLGYSLWPFQERILQQIEGDTLVLGLPTGLGKTFLAGAYLQKRSQSSPIRVLFLVPSVPLGVQQTLFVRRMLNVQNAFFVSGQIPPEKRGEMKVWNFPIIVSTPQTFFNDFLSPLAGLIQASRQTQEPIETLAGVLKDAAFTFPFDLVLADECQRYVGETDGYSILLAAKACGVQMLALSATPQLHAPRRLRELQALFNRIRIFSLDEPEIKERMPRRVLRLVRVSPPEKLLWAYEQLGIVVDRYVERVKAQFGPDHLSTSCRTHYLCTWLRALQVLKMRMVEDGASSVANYGAWRLKALNEPIPGLGGRSIRGVFEETLREHFNHKIQEALRILDQRVYEKAIVFMEPVEAAKQLGELLQRKYGVEQVAVLVGKGSMSMEQQASALLQFRGLARILAATSVAEEGLDIP